MSNNNQPAIFVFGPKACGKTRNMAAIAAALGYEKIVDDWEIHQPTMPNALHLTSAPEGALLYRNRISFNDAMAVVERAETEPMTCADFTEERAAQKGDQVRLNSDSVWMTVLYTDCTEADCAWFSGTDLQQETFPLECLTTSEEMPF